MNSQFWIITFIGTSVLVGCGAKNKTKIIVEKPKNKLFSTYIPGRVGFVTAMNLINNEINDFLNANTNKLNYKLEGELNSDFKFTPTTTRVYNVNNINAVIKILKSLNDNRVDLTFAQIDESYSKVEKSSPDDLISSKLKSMRTANKKKLFEALNKKHIYQGKLILLQNNEELNLSKFDWNKLSNVAFFRYSQIFSNYMLGYQCQSYYGANNESVGYLLAALVGEENSHTKTNVNLINAFWAGVTTASNKSGIGKAHYARKPKIDSKKNAYENLFFNLEISNKEFIELIKDSNYKNQDHSITYLAGAPGTKNSKIAHILKNYAVNNSVGHKMIINRPETSDNFTFNNPTKTHTILGNKNNQNVTGIIATSLYIKDAILADDLQKKKNANQLAMELILEHLYQGKAKNTNYFNKINYIGNLSYLLNENNQWALLESSTIKKDVLYKQLTLNDLIKKDITGYSN